MSKQPIELLLVNIELLSETLLHCVTSNSNMHQLGQPLYLSLFFGIKRQSLKREMHETLCRIS